MATSQPPSLEPSPGRARWAGRIMSGAAVLFLLVDALGKILRLEPVMEGTVALGFPASTVAGIGVVELIGLVLYGIPATAPLGAVLLTGFLGGAVATHVRLENPLLTHVLFPTYVAALLWAGLFLRDPRVRLALASPRRSGPAAIAEGGR
jgi:hypothetical protein